MNTKEKLAINIRRIRKLRNFSQEDFANEIGISPFYYGEIERGRANPTVVMLESIAKGLNVDVSELLTIPPEP